MFGWILKAVGIAFLCVWTVVFWGYLGEWLTAIGRDGE